MALTVTPAHVHDGDMAPDLMEQVAVRTKVEFFVLDAGYDQLKNYETARNLNAQAIIPMNLRNEKQPPAGMMSNGTPCCSMGFSMTYWGADGDILKFRCPHATGKVDCPLGMAACSSSNYGMVVKVNTTSDLRRYSTPHRDSKRWKELYNERTSVERCHSRLKTFLTADAMHVWGIRKVTTHQYLNAIVLLASALAMNVILHPTVNTPFLSKHTLFSIDKIEREANEFAVELLMPDEWVYENRNTAMTIYEAAAVYGIPPEVAHLKKL
jgi:hypothetical protein